MLKPESVPGKLEQVDHPRLPDIFTIKSHCPDQCWCPVDVPYMAESVNECRPWAGQRHWDLCTLLHPTLLAGLGCEPSWCPHLADGDLGGGQLAHTTQLEKACILPTYGA